MMWEDGAMGGGHGAGRIPKVTCSLYHENKHTCHMGSPQFHFPCAWALHTNK